MRTYNALRIMAEMSAVAVGLILGAIGGLSVRQWLHGRTMGIDEIMLFTYAAPGAAVGVFVATGAVLYFRRKLSLPVFCGALLGAAAGIGLSAFVWEYVLEPAKFEPPGEDILFMLFYFGLFTLSGIMVGAVAPRMVVGWLSQESKRGRNQS